MNAGEEPVPMSEWMSVENWPYCVELARPGIVFEIQNAAGQRMVTPCVLPLPPAPFDWRLPPTRFRAVLEVPAERSAPIPAPKLD